MKKSTILIISIFVFALGWTITYDVLIASVIKTTVSGNGISKFGHNSQKAMVKSLRPFNKIRIIYQGSPQIFITKGDSCEISIGEGYYKNLTIADTDQTLSITAKPSGRIIQETIHIKVPDLKDISIQPYNIKGQSNGRLMLQISEFKSKELTIYSKNIFQLIIRNSQFGNLTFRGSVFCSDYVCGEINIEPSNKIDSLNIGLSGRGYLTVSKAGDLYNNITLSDSIQVKAGMPVMQKLFGK